jgi:release factor glutamine methyltransferase
LKISDALSQARQILNSNGVSDSRLDVLILLSYAISFSKEQIIFNPDFELNSAQQEKFFDFTKRRAAREPVSQIIGKREFFGEDFFVSSDVLDPRPDSESLIELVLKNFPKSDHKLKILELGVGSGCLIISLLKAYQSASATGLDISEQALKICQKNSLHHKTAKRLTLKKSDLFSALQTKEKFDLIISNPPYIPSAEIEKLEPEVRLFEPRMALDGGADGLNFYRAIAADAKNFLNENGKIIVEIGFDQSEKIIEIFAAENIFLTESKPDLSGITRALCFTTECK